MMSIAQVRSAGSAGNYYTDKDNYYVLGSMGERWAGQGAEQLGLQGSVDKDVFTRLLEGRLPDGADLSRMQDGRNRHRPGYDLTFSAPKSVSMMAMLGGDKRLIEAHNQAVDFAVRQVEALASTRVMVPAMQTEDIISVINWAEKQVCIDNQRIGLWGTSLGGCHVFNAAAQDKRVKSIVSQLAFADGEVLVTGEMNELEKASFLSTLNKMAEKKKNTGKEMFVGVTRVLSDNESKVFFEKVKGQYPEMDIKIPFLTVMETLQYKPAESAAKVQCPVLVVIAGQDSVNPPEQGRALYDAVASGTKELYEEADACHYDIYEGAFFERVAAVQTQWFKKHL
ncbi:hypothetical protein BvCms2894_01143 [Escherichia coli]|nr:MobF family relaxase [Escherichia coli]GCO18071.1 hypothetical protein BvCms2894_01143 [Escherichia coli]